MKAQAEFLVNQLMIADGFTIKIVKSFDDGNDFQHGDLHTDLNWQLGHVVMSKYFFIGLCTIGHVQEFRDEFPIRNWNAIYGRGSTAQDSEQRETTEQLMLGFKFLSKEIYPRLLQLTNDELSEEALKPHEVAKTKAGALQFAAMHQMWHNGQMSLIKRHVEGSNLF